MAAFLADPWAGGRLPEDVCGDGPGGPAASQDDQHQGTTDEFGRDADATLFEPLLTPLAAIACSGASLAANPEWCLPAWHPPPAGAAQYHQQYLHMAAWLGVLYAGYAVQRAACQLGLPYDGLRQVDFYEVFSDVTSIFLYGLVLGWFVGVTCPARFHWLFNRQRWYAWATLLGTPPVYSAISNVKVLKRDLADLGAWGLPFILVWSAGMAAILGVVAWHLLRVSRSRRWPDAAAYAASRLLLLGFFGGSAAVLRRQGVEMHLHHLYLGWSFALWAELNHWLSALTLAVGCGIFLQGVGAYSFAPVFLDACFSPPTAASLQCDFWAASPFALRICAAAGPLPGHSCT